MSSSTKGPGYPTPLYAMVYGPREEILYVGFNDPNPLNGKSDFLGTIDVDPNSPTYCKMIHKTYTEYPDDQLHHFGWNVCSSCYRDRSCRHPCIRDKLVLPGLESKRVYIMDTGKNSRAPEMYKIIDATEISKFNCSYLHTTHCLPTGEIMISFYGDNEGNFKGNFLLFDTKTFKIKGLWNKNSFKSAYDFWYQPYHDILAVTEFGAPKELKKGFEVCQIPQYGRHLNLYSWSTKKLIKRIDLGDDGIIGLAVRFLHDPKESRAFFLGSLNSHVFRLFKKDNSDWSVQKVISVNPKKVSGWILDYMPGLISDLIISLDDKYMYITNYLHGDVRQYDISNREKPILTVLEDQDLKVQPDPVIIKGKKLNGGPHRMQLSLDGKRLYVSSGLYTPWDRHLYPDNFIYGGFLVKIDCNIEHGGMTLDTDFYVNFNEENNGPLFPHEIRYPGGDCSSDIWLADD
ncbi:hypothetical protein RN001_009143 [Aquatica leii]|uniref:Methanethiol oxidase n=1 Tax=Aquatica leii TaxID=1421715 RepID=A0AAN7PV28_9COLE|nr:hypothetical protein RN001_009143 [Aquatica leii]